MIRGGLRNPKILRNIRKSGKAHAMSITAPSSEVQKAFGAFHDRALSEPVRVTKYGRETVYIVSAETFHALKQGRRDAIAAADLSDEEAALIAAARIPPEHRYSLDDDD